MSQIKNARPTRADHWDDLLEPRAARLPDGGELATLRGAGQFINALPKQVQDREPWQFAVLDLLKAADGRGPWRVFAGLAINRALYGETAPPIGNPDAAAVAEVAQQQEA